MEKVALVLWCWSTLLASVAQAKTLDVIAVEEGVSSVRLKCLDLTNHTGPFAFQWELSRHNQTILERSPSGIVIVGDNFTGSAAVEDNGDLILYDPQREQSGIYTCNSFSANSSEDWTSSVYLYVKKAISETERMKSTLTVAMMSLDIVAADVNILLLLIHCETYRKHKDIWSLRLFFLSYFIIYGIAGLVFLLLYVIGTRNDFLFSVGMTCSATSIPPVVILWIDFIVMLKRSSRTYSRSGNIPSTRGNLIPLNHGEKRARMSEDAFNEEMVPVIRTPGYLANGENSTRDGDGVRKRYNVDSKTSKGSTCCSGETETDGQLETVELTGHSPRQEGRSLSRQT